MTSNLPAEPGQMTKAEAEKLTRTINRDGTKLGALLFQAHEGRAWAALGYRSWTAYIDSEFTFSRATSYRLLAAEREPDALVQDSECLTDETDGPQESLNRQVVDALDVNQRPLDTITPDAVLPPPKRKAPAKTSEGGEQDGETRPAPSACPPSGKSLEGKNGAGSSPHSAPGDSAARPGSPSNSSSEGGSGERATSAPSKLGIDVPGSVPPPSDPPSGGAELQPPTGPTDVAAPKRPTSRSAPPGPSDPVLGPCCNYSDHSPGPCTCTDHGASALHPFGGSPARPPSARQLAARVYAAMREVDPTDAGPVTTPEEATFLRQWAQRTLDAWKAKNVPTNGNASYQMMADQHDQAKPPAKRRQGTISRPADRAPKPPVKVNGAPTAGSLTRRTVEPMFKP